MKFYLRRIRLNQGGYDRSGRYYGTGQPLFEAQCDDVDDGYAWEFRADDRADARAIVRAKYPDARFFN